MVIRVVWLIMNIRLGNGACLTRKEMVMVQLDLEARCLILSLYEQKIINGVLFFYFFN